MKFAINVFRSFLVSETSRWNFTRFHAGPFLPH